MRIRVDPESDALYFRLKEGTIEESEAISPDIILDYDPEGKIMGIEIINLSKHFTSDEISELKVEFPAILARK